MTPDKILDALNDLDGSLIREAKAQTQSARKRPGRRFGVLLAAVIALMAVTITAFASEAVYGWFRQYFGAKTEADLTPGQVEYIEQNEQVIAEVQEQNGWTVELKSILSNVDITYVTFGVRAPADVALVDEKIYFGKGIEIWDEQKNPPFSYSFQSQDDMDGLENTINLVMTLGRGEWNAGAKWNIRIDGLYTEVYNEAYEQELLETKYAGQTDVMFTSEETEKIYLHPQLTDGKWTFTIDLETADTTAVELITQPITVYAYVWDSGDPKDVTDDEQVYKEVRITSFVLNSLSATIDCGKENAYFGEMYIVMKDGSKILLQENYGTIKAETPIVLSEVDHILFADGTKLPMPE